MVKNRKSGEDIAEQLHMFLGDDTKLFVDWWVPTSLSFSSEPRRFYWNLIQVSEPSQDWEAK